MRLVFHTGSEKTNPCSKREIQYIVVHETAADTLNVGSAEATAKLFSESDSPASADFIVDDETAVQYNPDPENRFCRHCGGERAYTHGGSLYRLCTDLNSIGVVICSTNRTDAVTSSGDPCRFFTDAALANAAELIAELMDAYCIDISHVVRHYDVSGTLCPGIIGWNEDSGHAESWYAFRQACRKRSKLANRGSGCTITGSEILYVLSENGITCTADEAFLQTTFSSLAVHSGQTAPGALFFCKGKHFHPEYLRSAAENGAVGYLSETKIEAAIPCLLVSDIAAAMGLVAQAFYSFPQKELTTVGVTGTNGKTTVSQFIVNILKEASGKRPGFLSTVSAYDGLRERDIALTTPEAPVIYSFLHETKRNGGTHFVMECSSQGEKMKRLTGLQYDLGVFTNISDDHYSPQEHSSFEEYLGYKLDIIRRYQNAVINVDDPHCAEALRAAAHAERVVTYSLSPDTGADVYAEVIHKRGLRPVFTAVTPEWKQTITVPFPGEFNISNALAACAAGYLLGISPEKIAAGIEKTFVHGRMFVFDRYGYSVVVDYAHNYASIRAAMEATRELYPNKKIQLLFGCAGTNGLQRRRDIVRAAAPFCEKFYITTDDPYDDDPDGIIREIEGYARQENVACICIADRTQCVERALESMTQSDVLFITAKGAEAYIKYGKNRIYYESDPSIVWRMLYRKRGYAADRNNFYTWRIYDEVYNEKEAWPVEEYPDAPYTTFDMIGCYIVSLAIMLRHFGIVTEPSFEKFNPWILYERLKSIRVFDSAACVDTARLSEIFPVRIVDSVPYDRQTLIRSLEEGYACQIIVPGHNASQHYVIPVRVTENDVEIVDCAWNTVWLSDLAPQWIARYLPTENSAMFRITDQASTWYWFRQTEDVTAYDPYHPQYGRFGRLFCGNGTDFESDFISSGCAIYALAIALSNALHCCITPFDALLDVLQAPISRQGEGWTACLDGSHGIDMVHQSYPIILPGKLCDAVQTALPECRAVYLEDFRNSQPEIDDVLRSGGCILLSVDPCAFYTGEFSHMIVLREKKADGKYYALTSAKLNTFGNTEEDLIRAMLEIGVDWDSLCESVSLRPCCIALTRKS